MIKSKSMKEYKIVQIIAIISTVVALIPLVISLSAHAFLPENIPMHYNSLGVIDRWGKSYEMIILAVGLALPSLIMTLIFYKINMDFSAKLIGLIGAIVMSVTFIIMQSVFTAKALDGAVSTLNTGMWLDVLIYLF